MVILLGKPIEYTLAGELYGPKHAPMIFYSLLSFPGRYGISSVRLLNYCKKNVLEINAACMKWPFSMDQIVSVLLGYANKPITKKYQRTTM